MDNFYKLVYIKGISRFDTWRFANKEAQYTYFNGFVGSNTYIVNDYFPPHYTNTIRFDKNEIDYASKNYNYLLLYFDNKYYCYFIDNINYINEDVFELELTMDTIQTYMFDVNFTSATLDRLSIKRWTNVANREINRNYKRENLSQEDFVIDNHILLSKHKYCVILQVSQVSFVGVSQSGIFTTNKIDNTITSSGFHYLAIPLVYYENTNNFWIVSEDIKLYQGSTLVGEQTLSELTLNSIITNPAVINAWIVDDYMLFKLFSRIITENVITYLDEQHRYSQLTQHVSIFATNNCTVVFARIENNSGPLGIYLGNMNSIDNYISHTITFIPNSLKAEPFDTKYIPALLDENYITLKFGEKTNYSTFPLSKSYTNIFDLYNYYDIYTGERTYKILPRGVGYDYYNTFVSVATQQSMELLNNAWENYKSQNHATLTTGRALNTIMPFVNAGVGLLGFELSQYGRQRTRKDKPTNKYIRALKNPVTNVSREAINEFSNQMDYLITRENLQHTPNTEKQGNNYSNDIDNKSLDIIIQTEKVKDFENVGKLIEQFGYSVDLTYNNTNIFDINYRYYYNVLRCSSIKVDATGCMIPEGLKQDFMARCMEGLRLWNNENNTDMYDNINYDNVENDFIVEE